MKGFDELIMIAAILLILLTSVISTELDKHEEASCEAKGGKVVQLYSDETVCAKLEILP